MKETKNEKGQVLLIVLFTMAVALVLVLSIVSRSITDISVSTREQEAQRAFSAAEAGIEKGLILGPGSLSGSGFAEGTTYNATIQDFAGGTKAFNSPLEVLSGDVVPMWFVAHKSDDTLGCDEAGKPCFTGSRMKVCWGKAGNPQSAMELSILYKTDPTDPDGDYSSVQVARATFDPDSSRLGSNHFQQASSSPACSIDGKSYPYWKEINFSDLGISCSAQADCLQTARVRLLYNTTEAHPVGFDVNYVGNSNLPSQGTRVISTGSAGEANRTIEVTNLFSDLPPIFDSGVFTSGSLIKN